MEKEIKTVLVTGGSGFLGINLIRHLRTKGVERIRVLDIAPFDYPEAKAPWLEFTLGDVRDPAAVNTCVEGCDAVVNTAAVKPVTESLKETGYDGSEMKAYLQGKCECIFIDAEEVCKPFGSSKFFNIIMLGVAAGSGCLGLKKETLLKQIEQYVPSRFLDVNIRAFNAGIEIAGQASGNPKGAN